MDEQLQGFEDTNERSETNVQTRLFDEYREAKLENEETVRKINTTIAGLKEYIELLTSVDSHYYVIVMDTENLKDGTYSLNSQNVEHVDTQSGEIALKETMSPLRVPSELAQQLKEKMDSDKRLLMVEVNLFKHGVKVDGFSDKMRVRIPQQR